MTFILTVGAVAVVFLWPSSWGGALWGHALGEADNHLWMFWRAVQQAGGAGTVANAPDGIDLPLMDPVNLPAFLLTSPLGAAAAWNATIVFDVLLAAIGGYALARCFVGERAALVGAVGTASAPFLAGVIDFGISESWPVGWLALHVAFLVGFSRNGGWKRAVAAGLCLGAAALSGWYQAFFGLLVEAMVVPVLLWRSRRAGLVWQGVIALVMVLPAWFRFRAVEGAWSARWHPPPPGPPGPREDWATLPVYGTDLLNLVLPHPEPAHPSKAVYLGLVLLGLCVVGVVRDWRRALPLLGLALPFLVLALGYWPTIAGRAIGLPGPANLLVRLVEPLQGLAHWHRAVGAAVPFVAAAAAVGAQALDRRAWVVPLLCGLVVLDSVAMAPVAWPRSTIRPDVPGIFEALPGPGGLVQIPFDNGRVPFSEEPARIYARWQVAHGRAVSENYEGIDALLARNHLVAAIDSACRVRSTLPPFYQPPPRMRNLEPPEGSALDADREQLTGWGYHWLVLHGDRCRRTPQVTQLVERILGASVAHEGSDSAWAL